ncbi:hypothetical protein [Massilia orientalis]|uniref:hypothetical protein n=1 Tax=Massilia orientalis TaxID=3050128 RepID=UPI0037DC22F3
MHHVRATLANKPQRQDGTNSVDLGQISSSQLVHCGADAEVWITRLLAAVSGFRQRCHGYLFTNVKSGYRTFNVGIAFIDTLLIKTVEPEGLLQCKQMLRFIVADKEISDRLDILLAADVAHCCKLVRISHACHDGSNNLHPVPP